MGSEGSDAISQEGRACGSAETTLPIAVATARGTRVEKSSLQAGAAEARFEALASRGVDPVAARRMREKAASRARLHEMAMGVQKATSQRLTAAEVARRACADVQSRGSLPGSTSIAARVDGSALGRGTSSVEAPAQIGGSLPADPVHSSEAGRRSVAVTPPSGSAHVDTGLRRSSRIEAHTRVVESDGTGESGRGGTGRERGRGRGRGRER